MTSRDDRDYDRRDKDRERDGDRKTSKWDDKASSSKWGDRSSSSKWEDRGGSRWGGNDDRSSRTFGRDKEADRDSYKDRGFNRNDSRPAMSFGKGGMSAGSNLGSIDWSNQTLSTFQKNFYTESDAVKNRSRKDIDAFRDEHKISIRSSNCPNPIFSFEEANLPADITRMLSSKFSAPTPIQSQGWPAALGGNDVIGIAQTGSGKTLSFLIPAFVHINAQSSLKYGDGPIGLVLAPTRELAMQIQEECLKFGREARITSTCIFGGADKWPQKRDLQRGNHIVVATPGRLLDFLDMGVINLKRVTYLVLDEADRMLDMGFEPQIRKVLSQVRPDRQTLMWSATWPKEVQRLANEFTAESPVHIVIGNKDLAVNLRIKQYVEIVDNNQKKFRIPKILESELKDGAKILIFTQTKRGADYLTNMLGTSGYSAISIHGDKTQAQRDYIMRQYKQGRTNILVATDLAARGLDVADIRCVINYDFPTHIEDYIHRVGRTGRAGRTGSSYTFFTRDDYKHAYKLVDILHETQQYVPDELYRLARRPIPAVRSGTAPPRSSSPPKSYSDKPSYSNNYSNNYSKPSSYSGSNSYSNSNSYPNSKSYGQSNTSSYNKPSYSNYSSNPVPSYTAPEKKPDSYGPPNPYKSNQSYGGVGAYFDPNQANPMGINPYAMNFNGYQPLNPDTGYAFNNIIQNGQAQSYHSLNNNLSSLVDKSGSDKDQKKA